MVSIEYAEHQQVPMRHQGSDVTESPSQNGLLHIVLGTAIRDTQLKNIMNFRPAIWAN